MNEQRAKLTVTVSADTVNRARAATAGMQRQDPTYTLTQLVTEALEAHIHHLEVEHHGGRPWPTTGRLRSGRPLGEV